MRNLWVVLLGAMTGMYATAMNSGPLELTGMTVTPHFKLDTMEYLHEPEPAVGARVQIFVRNGASASASALEMDGTARVLFDGKSPQALLDANIWAWHDLPSALPDERLVLPPGALTVWNVNGRVLPFGPGGKALMEMGPAEKPWISQELAIEQPVAWLSAVTFLGPEQEIYPDTMVVHLANESSDAVTMRSCRLWLPEDPKNPKVLFAGEPFNSLDHFNGHASIPAGDRGGFFLKTGALPLTYTAVEVVLASPDGVETSVWAYLRIKPECFDISGGWVNGKGNPVSSEVFLKALKSLYINTAHIATTPGYTNTELYAQYPLKYFNKLQPFETYDTDEMLKRIHAVEFLGEPQFGGGRPVPPQEVWQDLFPYTRTRLATSVTHSEERIWRDYAGLSDYPHYDAYRVTAPSPDLWQRYERWGHRIFWGSPLETIGDMCRSLRELNRPMPCAIWSQGPHEGWGRYGGRARTSPTPDEIRLQAYHALSTRITSLYWFNLSLKTLVQWRDTLEEVARIGREMRMLDTFYLESDAYQFERRNKEDGAPDWDIASICGHRAAVLFALDLDYTADKQERVFKFGEPRAAQWRFELPAYLHGVQDVFRVDADGVYDVAWSLSNGAVDIQDTISRVAIYVAALAPGLRGEIETRRQELIAAEKELNFDLAGNEDDFAALEALWASIGLQK